jgi:hypothetical protein
MINFNFTLDDIDAENFCSILQDNIVNHMAKLSDDSYSKNEKEWFKKHIKYLKEMQNVIIKGNKKVS